QAKQQSQALQQVAVERRQTEVAQPGGAPAKPRVAALKVPPAQPVNAAAPPAGRVQAPAQQAGTPQTQPGAGPQARVGHAQPGAPTTPNTARPAPTTAGQQHPDAGHAGQPVTRPDPGRAATTAAPRPDPAKPAATVGTTAPATSTRPDAGRPGAAPGPT